MAKAKTTSTVKKDTSKTVKATPEVVEKVEIVEPQEINLDEKVTVRSIACWNTGFRRILDNQGDITITPKGTIRLSRNEIIAQVQQGNNLFAGVDGKGSHATLIVEDTPTRVEVGFEMEDGSVEQQVLTDDVVRELFDIKTMNQFEHAVQNTVVTRAEKYSVMDTIHRLQLNDYRKILYLENYTGTKMSILETE